MKKTIIMAMLVLMSTAAQAQKELFEKYEGTKDVTTVILSKAMLSLADKFASIGDSDIGGLAGRLDGIRILKCEKKALVPEIKSAAQAAYRRDKFEEIMSANDGGKLTSTNAHRRTARTNTPCCRPARRA